MSPSPKPRILLYSHDTVGLGHLRRSLTVAAQIALQVPGSHQLLVTGSTVAGAFGLPPRADMVKLPALSKRSSGEYRSRTLPLTLRQTLAWREQMILDAARNFRPDILLVDKVAGGVHGELLPTLRFLKTWAPETRIVLGMRDIEDSPAVTRGEWAHAGVISLLRDVYDRILLYGRRDVFDPITAYGLPADLIHRVVECGYLRRDQATRDPEAVRRELNIGSRPLVVVTVGGGGDGHEILKAALQVAQEHREWHLLLVTGPLMPQKKRRALRREARHLPVTLLEFTADLSSYVRAADVVVGMAGYNTVCELLSLGKRAILIPRVRVRVEQELRAARLAALGLVDFVHPLDLTPERLGQAITAALDSNPPARLPWPMEGQERAADALVQLLSDKNSSLVHTPRSRKRDNGASPSAAGAPTQEIKA